MSILEELKRSFKAKNNGLTRLIIVNVAVFLIANIILGLGLLAGTRLPVVEYLALPSDLDTFFNHFWTLVTYMFFHLDFWHILSNLIWLYFIGGIFTEFMGSRRLVGVYVLGGLAGGIFFLLTSSLLPALFGHSVLLGASAGVMAVVVATGVYAPNLMVQVFMWPVRLKYVVLASFILSSVMDITSNTGGKISHFGGALFGLLFALQYKKGNDLSRGITGIFDLVSNLRLPASKPKVKVAYKRPVSDEQYNQKKINDQQRVNEILDKISKGGYESLSKEEKDFLFNASRKM